MSKTEDVAGIGSALPPFDLRRRVGLIEGSEGEYGGGGRAQYRGVLETLPEDFDFEGKRILDFGCGAGRVLRHFMQRPEPLELWGCDVHAPSIEWIQENLSPPIHAFANDTLPPLALDDGSIDLVYALSVFTHLAEDWSAWAEAWHALDEGPVRALAEDAVARPQESHALSLAGERVVRTWRPAPRPWWKNLLGARAVHAQPLLAAL